MPQTKSSGITSKIIQAESLRLGSLRQDPEFKADLERLEQTAKHLPRIPKTPLTPKNWMPPWMRPGRARNKYFEWWEAKKAFVEKWGFKPYLTSDNEVTLAVRSPVSATIQVKERFAIWKQNEKYFSAGDVQMLKAHYAKLMKERGTLVERRVNLDTMERRAMALELEAKGKSPREIAKKIYSKRYKKLVGKTVDLEKLPEGELRDRFHSLVSQYSDQGLPWPTAEKKAASILHLDIRSKAAKIKPLTARTRYLLKSRKK